MGKRGFQQRGMPNPLLIRKKKPSEPQATDKTIKNYLSRPRLTLDEVKSAVAAKDAKSLRMAQFEDSQAKDFRKELDKYRKKVLKQEKRKKKEEKKEKKRRKEEKRRKTGKEEKESEESEEDEKKTGGSSPVQLSKFFSFVGDDISDGEIPLSDDEETPNSTTATTNTNNTTTTTDPSSTNATTATPENGETKGRKRKRWDEKPAIFQNQTFPTNSSTTPIPSPIALPVPSIPQIPFPHLPVPLPLASPLFLPTQPNIHVLHQLKIHQQIHNIIQMQQATLSAQQAHLHQTLSQTPLPLQAILPVRATNYNTCTNS